MLSTLASGAIVFWSRLLIILTGGFVLWKNLFLCILMRAVIWAGNLMPRLQFFCISVRKEQVELYARQDVHLLYSYMTKRMLLKYD